MGRKTWLTGWLMGCAWIWVTQGCNNVADATHVDFGDTQPVGRWQPETESSAVEVDSETDDADETSVTVNAGSGASVARPIASNTVMGMSAPTSPSPVGGAAAATGGSGGGAAEAIGGPDAGAAADMDTAPMDAGHGDMTAGDGLADAPQEPQVSTVTFTVTTEPVGGRYRPKNIGAIWVTDASGQFVKSLEVWARTRRRWLTKYNAARGNSPIDVTATATLTRHRTHMATWDLTDAGGGAVEPGKYKLFAEITDADTTGKSVSIDFDTGAGPDHLTPNDATGFTQMTLDLE